MAAGMRRETNGCGRTRGVARPCREGEGGARFPPPPGRSESDFCLAESRDGPRLRLLSRPKWGADRLANTPFCCCPANSVKLQTGEREGWGGPLCLVLSAMSLNFQGFRLRAWTGVEKVFFPVTKMVVVAIHGLGVLNLLARRLHVLHVSGLQKSATRSGIAPLGPCSATKTAVSLKLEWRSPTFGPSAQPSLFDSAFMTRDDRISNWQRSKWWLTILGQGGEGMRRKGRDRVVAEGQRGKAQDRQKKRIGFNPNPPVIPSASATRRGPRKQQNMAKRVFNSQ